MLSRANIQQQLDEERQIQIKFHFNDNCLAKNLFHNIKNLVKTAKETYKEDLDIRRDRLRQLIESEEHGYELEYRREVESRLENTIRQRQEMLVKIRNEKLKEEAEFNKMKKAEQIMNNSDQFRTVLSNESLRNTKEIQLIQIEEGKQKRLAEKELECMWLDVQNRINEIYDKKQEYENCLLKSINIKTRDYNLDKVHLSKMPIDMTSDYYEGFGSLLKNDLKSEQDKIMKRKQTDIQNAIYNKNLNEIRKQKECRELEIEQLYNDESKREHLIALQKMEEQKVSNRKEIETYLNYVRNLKSELEKEKCEENQLLLMEQMKTQCKQYEKYQNWKNQIELNAKKNHQILLQQIREHDRKKFDETILINEQHLADKELQRRRNCEEDFKANEKKNKVLKLADDLKLQAQEDKLRRAWYRRRDFDDYRRALDYQNNIDSLAMKYGKDLNSSKPHPNMKLLDCPCEKP